MSKAKTRPRYSPEMRERAVRMVLEHEADYSSRWAAIESVAAKIGSVAQTLDHWIKQAQRDNGAREHQQLLLHLSCGPQGLHLPEAMDRLPIGTNHAAKWTGGHQVGRRLSANADAPPAPRSKRRSAPDRPAIIPASRSSQRRWMSNPPRQKLGP